MMAGSKFSLALLPSNPTALQLEERQDDPCVSFIPGHPKQTNISYFTNEGNYSRVSTLDARV